MNRKFCKCGKEIDPRRVAALESMTIAKKMQCIDCANGKTNWNPPMPTVAAYPIIDGKTSYSRLEFASSEAVMNLHDANQRKGQGPMMGIQKHRTAERSKNRNQ